MTVSQLFKKDTVELDAETRRYLRLWQSYLKIDRKWWKGKDEKDALVAIDEEMARISKGWKDGET